MSISEIDLILFLNFHFLFINFIQYSIKKAKKLKQQTNKIQKHTKKDFKKKKTLSNIISFMLIKNLHTC